MFIDRQYPVAHEGAAFVSFACVLPSRATSRGPAKLAASAIDGAAKVTRGGAGVTFDMSEREAFEVRCRFKGSSDDA